MSERMKAGRRHFLEAAAVAGGGAAVAVAAKAALAETAPTPVHSEEQAKAAQGYHVTPHIEAYYRLARD